MLTSASYLRQAYRGQINKSVLKNVYRKIYV